MNATTDRGLRKTREGVVVSDAMDKTRTVRVTRRVRHPLYGKEMKKSGTMHVHDENNESHVGDVVRIAATRPISRMKRWRLVEIIRKSM